MTHKEALKQAIQSLEAIHGLLSAYPRPSLDPHGRLLLDAREHAAAAACQARWVLEQEDRCAANIQSQGYLAGDRH